MAGMEMQLIGALWARHGSRSLLPEVEEKGRHGEGAPCSAEQRREESGVWEKGEGGLPFIEPSSRHVRLHQQVAGAIVTTLDDVFWHFPLGIGSWLLHKISSLIYTLHLL
jgi:hypothetical protein